MNILTNMQYTLHNIVELYKTFFKKNFKLLLAYAVFINAVTFICLVSLLWFSLPNYADDYFTGMVEQVLYTLANTNIAWFAVVSVLFYGVFAAFIQRVELDEDNLSFKNIFSFITNDEKLAFLGGTLIVFVIAYFTSTYYGLGGGNFFYGFSQVFDNSVFGDNDYTKPYVLVKLLNVLGPYVLKYSVLLFVCWLLAKNYGKYTWNNICKAAIVSLLILVMIEALTVIVNDAYTLIMSIAFYILGSERATSMSTVPIIIYIVGAILTIVMQAVMIPALSGTLIYSNSYYVEDNAIDTSVEVEE